ncbi:hypothetical protein [Crenothrix polyspora]|uniref:Uncharacterized protein n=1 Tax=Crenothrix polyspora TaxID=360316 RepID=A0A1R4HJ08_9GAMM|nr:hypothetical protein [Crenothrix polyspora]SJM96215.1 hypothetical protein CRENPOLYSF1_860014 [Crenothrix polyspora]
MKLIKCTFFGLVVAGSGGQQYFHDPIWRTAYAAADKAADLLRMSGRRFGVSYWQYNVALSVVLFCKNLTA